METTKKYKWALTGLIVMILLNAATLTTIWINQPDGRDWKKHRDGDRDRDTPHQFMKKELGLSDQQAEDITRLRREHYAEIRAIKEQLNEDRRAYMDFLMGPDANTPQTRDSLITQLTRRYAEIEESLYLHMSEMKEVLDEEQQQEFNQIMKDYFFKKRNNDEDRRRKRNR